MILLPLAWTLLTVSLWTSGSSQILQQEPVKVLYPKILSTESIECVCTNISCDSVYWFRSISNFQNVQYLGRCNNADRATYGADVDRKRFKLSRKSSSSFTLRITNVTEEDTGIYSCVLKDRKNVEMWRPGVLLLPGELCTVYSPCEKTGLMQPYRLLVDAPNNLNSSQHMLTETVTVPTLRPTTLLKVKPVCRCPKKNPPPAPDGCGSLVLWPMVGLDAALALALICTLYYFSRLPKKCRHHFVKKRQMTQSTAYI